MEINQIFDLIINAVVYYLAAMGVVAVVLTITVIVRIRIGDKIPAYALPIFWQAGLNAMIGAVIGMLFFCSFTLSNTTG